MDTDTKSFPTKLLWVDLEMTGLDPKQHVIIEVAAVITDFNFNVLGQYEALVLQPEAKLTAMDPWAQNQHDTSGLTDKVRAHGVSELEVERQLDDLIATHFGDEPAVLAGNSIYNDRVFIKQYWKSVEQRLHYRMLDVSSLKVFMQGRYGLEYKKGDGHRAQGDIEASIAELKYYLEWLQKGESSGP